MKFHSNSGKDKHKHKGSVKCYIKEKIQMHLCYNSRTACVFKVFNEGGSVNQDKVCFILDREGDG